MTNTFYKSSWVLIACIGNGTPDDDKVIIGSDNGLLFKLMMAKIFYAIHNH